MADGIVELITEGAVEFMLIEGEIKRRRPVVRGRLLVAESIVLELPCSMWIEEREWVVGDCWENKGGKVEKGENEPKKWGRQRLETDRR
jgi:hypothetical protein